MIKAVLLSMLLLSSQTLFAQGSVSKNFLIGKVLNNSLNSDTSHMFTKMQKAIKDELQIDIWVESGTRNFDRQKAIWESKWCGRQYLDDNKKTLFKYSNDTGCKKYSDKLTKKQREKGILVGYSNEIERAKEILKYSSMPGTSRHHWGTDVDINNTNPNYWTKSNGVKLHNWLKINAKSRFSFCQVYSERSTRGNKGYEEEKWHWSYMPLSKVYLQEFKTKVTSDDIKALNFLGSNVASTLIDEYTSSIDPVCNNL